MDGIMKYLLNGQVKPWLSGSTRSCTLKNLYTKMSWCNQKPSMFWSSTVSFSVVTMMNSGTPIVYSNDKQNKVNIKMVILSVILVR